MHRKCLVAGIENFWCVTKTRRVMRLTAISQCQRTRHSLTLDVEKYHGLFFFSQMRAKRQQTHAQYCTTVQLSQHRLDTPHTSRHRLFFRNLKLPRSRRTRELLGILHVRTATELF